MNIFVGNLASETSEEDLQQTFEKYGKIHSIKLIKDMFSGVSKGFGFVEMPSKAEAEAAIKELNVYVLNGKPMTVNEARPPRDKRKGGNKRRR